jgi:hypothetical protein
MFGRKPKELIIPPEVRSDPKACELVRVWAAHGKQHVSMSPAAWEEPATWGIVLVDLARHVANFYCQERGINRDKVLSLIKELFEAEWNNPTSEVVGGPIQ